MSCELDLFARPDVANGLGVSDFGVQWTVFEGGTYHNTATSGDYFLSAGHGHIINDANENITASVRFNTGAAGCVGDYWLDFAIDKSGADVPDGSFTGGKVREDETIAFLVWDAIASRFHANLTTGKSTDGVTITRSDALDFIYPTGAGTSLIEVAIPGGLDADTVYTLHIHVEATSAYAELLAGSTQLVLATAAGDLVSPAGTGTFMVIDTLPPSVDGLAAPTCSLQNTNITVSRVEFCGLGTGAGGGPCKGCPPFVRATVCPCGITDDFTRVAASGWGRSASGRPWQSSASAPALAALSTDGSRGIATIEQGVTFNFSYAELRQLFYSDATITAQVLEDLDSPRSDRRIRFGGDTVNFDDYIEVSLATDGTFAIETSGPADSTATAVDPTQEFRMRFLLDGTDAKAKVWQKSDPEPVGWDLTVAFAYTQLYEDFWAGIVSNAPGPVLRLKAAYDDVDVVGQNKCAVLTMDEAWVAGAIVPSGSGAWTFDPAGGPAIYATSYTGAVVSSSSGLTLDLTLPDPKVNDLKLIQTVSFAFIMSPPDDTVDNSSVEVSAGLNWLTGPPDVGGFAYGTAKVLWGVDHLYHTTYTLTWHSGPSSTGSVTVVLAGNLAANNGQHNMTIEWPGPGETVRLYVDGGLILSSTDDLGQPQPTNTPADATTDFGFFANVAADGATVVASSDKVITVGLVAAMGSGFLGWCPSPPFRSQPVHDELVAIGDGTTTAFYTDWPYRPTTLVAEVAGIASEMDATTPGIGLFTLNPPPPVGAQIRVSYRVA